MTRPLLLLRVLCLLLSLGSVASAQQAQQAVYRCGSCQYEYPKNFDGHRCPHCVHGIVHGDYGTSTVTCPICSTTFSTRESAACPSCLKRRAFFRRGANSGPIRVQVRTGPGKGHGIRGRCRVYV